MPTWIITDSVSMTNTPPMITSTSSWRTITAMRAEHRAERERTDVAHEHHRRIGVEPQEAQARAGDRRADDHQLARARAPAGSAGKSENTALPDAYANTPSAQATSTVGMIARPSRPSVRFTALEKPTIQK